jgi:hypothetical protein
MKPFYILVFIFAIISNQSFGQSVSSDGCPLMEIGISASKVSQNLYVVAYCNHGNVIATDAYVEVVIDASSSINRATVLPSSRRGTTYTFQLASVAASDCGQFYLEMSVSDDACTNARIYPNDPCQDMVDYYDSATNNERSNQLNGTVVSVVIAESNDLDLNVRPVRGGIYSVFEDNVILNTIPTDSLFNLPMLNDGGSTGVVTNTGGYSGSIKNPNGTSVGTDGVHGLSSARYCETQNNNTFAGNVTTTATNAGTGIGQTENATSSNDLGVTDKIISEKLSSAIVIAYPNPFSNYTTIEIEGYSYKNIQMQVIDVTGRIVKVLQVQKQQQLILQKENLQQGVYFYHLIGDGEFFHTGKLLLQ